MYKNPPTPPDEYLCSDCYEKMFVSPKNQLTDFLRDNPDPNGTGDNDMVDLDNVENFEDIAKRVAKLQQNLNEQARAYNNFVKQLSDVNTTFYTSSTSILADIMRSPDIPIEAITELGKLHTSILLLTRGLTELTQIET